LDVPDSYPGNDLLPSVNRNGQSSASPAPPPAPNRFMGVWKFNAEKSSAGTKTMVVTIEREGKDYKITSDTESERGYKYYYSASTSMKGEIVKTLDSDGKPKLTGYDKNGQSMFQEWRVTVESSDSFLIDWLGSFWKQERYEVSADGQTMTIKDVPGQSAIIGGKIDSNGHLTVARHVKVLDKVFQAR
jgi:hypothetical protein